MKMIGNGVKDGLEGEKLEDIFMFVCFLYLMYFFIVIC